MTKQELLAKLNCPEELINIAFVPVADVIKWVNELEDETPKITEVQLDELVEAIADWVDNEGMGMVDDYKLEINYNEVSLESIDFDTSKIKRNMMEIICDHIILKGE